jgi:signal transduction histidine kinase
MLRERYGKLTIRQAQVLQRVEENVKSLLTMIDSVLDIAKIAITSF